jgi:hypothetical protein
MDIVRKTIQAAIDPESLTDATPEKPYGGFIAVASDESRDRDGEELYQNEWVTPLPDHITIDTDHGMSVATTVGSARPYFEGKELMIDASFSSIERAQETRKLILEGHIKTVSVAALVDRSKKSGTPKRELLNVGIVAIPSNRNAIIFDAKNFDGRDEVKSLDEAARDLLLAVKAGAGNSAGSNDGALIQAIHDAAGHLGAACIVVEVPDEDVSGADDGANKSVEGAVTETKTGAVLEDDEQVEDEEYEEIPSAPPGAVEIGEVAPEVEASAEKFTTQEIVNAILGEKSIDVDGVTVSADQFKDALQQVISNASNSNAGEPQGESPAEAPVEKAAAAADVAPAPADETAVEAAESDVVDVEKRARRMAMAVFAASEALSD